MKQVEHKTEQGVILFVDVPDEASDLTLPKVGMIDLYFQAKVKSEHEEDNYISIALPDVGFQIIGLTSEVTEEQAKMMVHTHVEDNGNIYGYFDYPQSDTIKDTALDSFKSLMQHKKLYEVNPYPEPLTCCSGSIQSGCGCMGLPYNYSSQEELDCFYEAQERTSKRLVLFKPNEK